MNGLSVFGSEYVDDIGQEDDVEEDDNDYGNAKEPVTISNIHPAVVIFIEVSVDDVGNEDYKGNYPTKGK